MYYVWRERPALAMPPTAYAVLSPGGGWVRVSASRVVAEGRRISEGELRSQFRDEKLPDYPEAFRDPAPSSAGRASFTERKR